MYHRILVPLDGSPRAERILPHAEALAQKFGTQLVLVRVVEQVVSTVVSDDLLPFYDAKMVNGWLAEANMYLAGVQGDLRTRGIEAKTRVANGPVVLSILNVATQESADLIALA